MGCTCSNGRKKRQAPGETDVNNRFFGGVLGSLLSGGANTPHCGNCCFGSNSNFQNGGFNNGNNQGFNNGNNQGFNNGGGATPLGGPTPHVATSRPHRSSR